MLDYRPDLGVLVIGWLEGTTLDNEAFARPGVVRRAAAAIRLLHAGRRFDSDFDMFGSSRRYLAHLPRSRLPAPGPLPGPRRRSSSGSGARSPSRPGPTVPCNNDLLAANFIDDGEKIWLIDYEYAGNNDACFELGNTVQECRPRPGPARGAGRRLLRRGDAHAIWPGPGS